MYKRNAIAATPMIPQASLFILAEEDVLFFIFFS